MTSSKPYHLKSTVFSTVSSYDYRFGFNGKEKDDEIQGDGNSYDFGARIYDSRLGRFLSMNPIYKEHPQLSEYQFAGNTPIWTIDIDGLEPAVFIGSSKQVSLINKTLGNVNWKPFELAMLDLALISTQATFKSKNYKNSSSSF
jgi:RHS repeat-associated protein